MPIVSIDVRDGDPTVQASGQHRGTVTATFADGREVSRNLRAADADAWMDMVATISSRIQSDTEISDAVASVNPDTEVAESGEASQAQAAVAYLRAAWSEEEALDGYLLLERFNNWRKDNGWSMSKVVPRLLAAGLEQEEWDEIKAAYLYLSGSGRATALMTAQAIQAKWEEK